MDDQCCDRKSRDTFVRPQAKSKCGETGALSREQGEELDADPIDPGTLVQITIPLLRYRRLQIEGKFKQGELDELARNDCVVFQPSDQEENEDERYESPPASPPLGRTDDARHIRVVGAANASVDPVSGRYRDGIPKRLLEIHGSECHRSAKWARKY